MEGHVCLHELLLFFIWSPDSHQGEENLDQVKRKANLQWFEWPPAKLQNRPEINDWPDNINKLIYAESTIQEDSSNHLKELSAKGNDTCDLFRFPQNARFVLIWIWGAALGLWNDKIFLKLHPLTTTLFLLLTPVSSKRLKSCGSHLDIMSGLLYGSLRPDHRTHTFLMFLSHLELLVNIHFQQNIYLLLDD